MVVINVPGFVSDQPEVKYVGDKPVINVKIVDKQRRRNKSTGEWESAFINFHFECWETDALYHAEKLTRGRNVQAVGVNPRLNKWTDDHGVIHENLVYELASVAYPYQERQQQERNQSEGQGHAPQSRPSQRQESAQRPRYANQKGSGNASQSAEPIPRAPSMASQPLSQSPRANENAGHEAGKSRFNRSSAPVSY